MERLRNAIKRQAIDLDRQQASVRYGVISGVDPVRHLARVLMQPEGVLTGWLELSTPVPGWQMVPALGSQALVVPREGDSQNGVVIGYAYSNPSPPPAPANAPGTGGTASTASVPASSTETLLTGPGGAVLRLCANGTVYIHGSVGIDGDLHVNGMVFDQIGSLNGLRQHYDSHVHGGVQTGGGNTQTTSQPDP